MSRSLQDGRESLRLHCDRLRHEGVRLGPGHCLRLREGEASCHQTKPFLHETAGGVSGNSAGQVCLIFKRLSHLTRGNCALVGF